MEERQERKEEQQQKKSGFFDAILDRIGINEAPLFRTPDYMYNVSYWLQVSHIQ